MKNILKCVHLNMFSFCYYCVFYIYFAVVSLQDSDDVSLSSGDHKFSKSSMNQNKKRKKRRHR